MVPSLSGNNQTISVKKFMKGFKTVCTLFLWLLAGVLILAVFAGMLWISNGSFSGIPALVAAVIVSAGIGRMIMTGPSSGLGKILRLSPVIISLLIVFWAMLPLGPDVLKDFPNDPALEIWDLGKGRMVSVSHHPPADPATSREEAIIFVHGGPGAYVRDFDRDFFAWFAVEGFDVYTYDQAGAGRSPIIADIHRYSHEGNVADLAAIISRIDKPVILAGQSYGAAVIASYLDRYPAGGQISRVIFTEPGPLPGEYPADNPHYNEKTTIAENVRDPV